MTLGGSQMTGFQNQAEMETKSGEEADNDPDDPPSSDIVLSVGD